MRGLAPSGSSSLPEPLSQASSVAMADEGHDGTPSLPWLICRAPAATVLDVTLPAASPRTPPPCELRLSCESPGRNVRDASSMKH
jgi:hypothetical protein